MPGRTAVALVSLAFRKTPKRTCGIVGMLDWNGRLCAVRDLTCKVVELAMKQGLTSFVAGQGTTVTQQVVEMCEEVGFAVHIVAGLVDALPYLF